MKAYTHVLHSAMKGLMEASPSGIFKPHPVDGLEKLTWTELAPDVSDRGPLKRSWAAGVGCMIVHRCGVICKM